ncbi:hypothetical protein K9M74_02035 [Candidatus Woesearchaeota archaeon]|nr:hypothetical protein [Candidatus Woesearchaeota archaeon]
MATDTVILGIIIGTLAAIVYSLRVLILLERRIARMDLNIEALTNRVLQEELKIEREERAIEAKLGKRGALTKPKKAAKTSSTKKAAKKKPAKKRKK